VDRRYGAPVAGEEKELLAGFLDHYRQIMLRLCEGVSEEDLRRPLVPSGTSLLGMIKHLAYVERAWFQEVIAGEPENYPYADDDEGDLRIEPHETSAEIFDFYRAECQRSREILSAASLEDNAKRDDRAHYKVRWVVVHMIEETARHAGHADILRETIDGATGVGYS
jgi:uncharacterized damage-inducible protein DinB